MKSSDKIIVSKYSQALSGFDVAAIEPLLHDELKYLYFFRSVGIGSLQGKKNLIEHLQVSFAEMKANGLAVNATMKQFLFNEKIMLCLVLQPPHHFKFIYPTKEKEEIDLRKITASNAIFMGFNFKNDLIKGIDVFELVNYEHDKYRVESASLKIEINFKAMGQKQSYHKSVKRLPRKLKKKIKKQRTFAQIAKERAAKYLL